MYPISQPVFETRCLSSLTKVFADEDLKDPSFAQASALQKEVYSFQVAFRSNRLIRGIAVHVDEGDLGEVMVRSVGLAPSELPCYSDHDDNILRSTPGLYPDPLYAIDEQKGMTAFPNQWRSVWVTVEVGEHISGGLYPIEVGFQTDSGERLGQEVFTLEIVPVTLPPQRLIHTEWFSADCLATWYEVEPLSEEHWRLFDVYVENAVRHGINMILTPIFTPPLETEVGHERLTVQLVGVRKQGDTYLFNFEKLDRWISLCLDKGIRYFEMAHLFTQWGAKHAPKIIADVGGELRQIFGWDTDALGPEYRGFLAQFLPLLVRYLEEKHLHDQVYFHISDEPGMKDLACFQEASTIVRAHIKNYPVIDALSDYEFYQTGAVTNPVPANDHIEPFLSHGVQNLWTYYCCAQYCGVSNRFFNLPSARNRIIGTQLYKFNIQGFLHWGYNHWYSQKSIRKINPFTNTDAGHAFPSGDAFLVYPGENGPIDSLRFEVFYEALQDLRALQLLESLIGKDQVMHILEADLPQAITFDTYPEDSLWLLAMRERLNQKIKLVYQGTGNRN